MRAEDILSDEQSVVLVDGMQVRKGTIGAFLANARIISDIEATEEAVVAAKRDIVELLPALHALGVFDIFQVRDERLRNWVESQRE